MEAHSKHSALILHIEENLDSKSHRDLISAVNKKEGVAAVRSPATGSHLLVVDYDPLTTNYLEIMNQARRQSVAVQRVG